MYKYFADENVDFAVVECGMGGKGDATNVEKKNISIITSVAIDHTAFLGNTLDEIAAELLSLIQFVFFIPTLNVSAFLKKCAVIIIQNLLKSMILAMF